MIRYPKRFWLLAAGLAGLAGYVDAIGFLKLGGFFVSFMSGNSTRLAVGIVTSASAAETAGGLVGSFLLGTIIGALVGAAAGLRRKAAVLLLVSVLLFAAAAIEANGSGLAAAFVLAMAMGSENAVFQRDGEVSVGLTYMTGTLVKLGQRIASAITGGDRWAWAPHLILWCSLSGGAVVGAAAFLRVGFTAIWGAAIGATLLTAYAAIIGPND